MNRYEQSLNSMFSPFRPQNDNNPRSVSDRMMRDGKKQSAAMPLHGEPIGGA